MCSETERSTTSECINICAVDSERLELYIILGIDLFSCYIVFMLKLTHFHRYGGLKDGTDLSFSVELSRLVYSRWYGVPWSQGWRCTDIWASLLNLTWQYSCRWESWAQFFPLLLFCVWASACCGRLGSKRGKPKIETVLVYIFIIWIKELHLPHVWIVHVFVCSNNTSQRHWKKKQKHTPSNLHTHITPNVTTIL